MKAFTFFIAAALTLMSFQLSAQTRVERKSMSQGNYQAIVMDIPDLEDKVVADLWEDFTKDFYDVRTKYNRKTKEYFSDDAEVTAIGQGNTFDMYTRIEERGDGSQISVWFDLGGAYLTPSSHPDRYLEAEKMLITFGLEAAKNRVRMDIEQQEETLEDMEDDLKDLGKDKEDLEDDIRKAREAIAEAEAELQKNAAAQEAKQQEIEAQRQMVNETKKKLRDY